MTKNNLNLVDTYEVKEASYSITSAPVTSSGGFHILGRLVGPHFVPNGTSRNNRYYPGKLWEKVMSDPNVHQKLERKLMFGTIGHAENFDVEKFAREGLLSHITVNMWIDESSGLGMCEDWILDTPAGKNLFAMCKAGCRFYTSSRAAGSFKSEKYQGMPVVDEATYDLGGWDMVVDPGFLQADPSLVESLKRNGVTVGVPISETKNDGGNTMSAELIEKLTKEKIAVENGLREALQELSSYKKIGTPERIRECLKAYMELGKPGEISKSLNMAEAAIKKLQATVKKYESLGSVPDLEKALQIAETMLERYKTLGTPEDIEEALDRASALFKEYRILGTPKEIDEALDRATAMAQSTKKARNEGIAKRLAKAYKAPFKTAYVMVEKLGPKEAERMLKSLREEDESGYRLGLEWPGNEADDILTKHFDGEGETILGDTVGPEGGIDLDQTGTSDDTDLGVGDDDKMGDLGDAGPAPDMDKDVEGTEDEDEDDDLKKEALRRARARKLTESKKTGFQKVSVFEQLISKH